MLEKSIDLNPKKIGFTILGMDILICFLSTALWYFPKKYQIPVANLDEMFYLDNEQNVPTYYSVLILLFAFLVTYFIARLKKTTKDSFYPQWMGLAIGFFILSADEFIMLHEKLKRFTFHVFPKDSYLYNSGWVTMGVITALVVSLFFLYFVMKLPRKPRNIIIAAGIIYLTGALVIERIGYSILDIYGNGREFVLISMVEEFMEMAGITLYIYGLLDYLKQMMVDISVKYQPLTENKRL